VAETKTPAVTPGDNLAPLNSVSIRHAIVGVAGLACPADVLHPRADRFSRGNIQPSGRIAQPFGLGKERIQRSNLELGFRACVFDMAVNLASIWVAPSGVFAASAAAAS
jgi:hypothetical protein